MLKQVQHDVFIKILLNFESNQTRPKTHLAPINTA